MTIASAYDHSLGILSLLTGAGLTAFLSRAPDTTFAPYVVLHADAGEYDKIEGALANPLDTFRLPFQVTAVGIGPEQALSLADKVLAALVYVVPTVTGRVCRPIVPLSAQPIQRDDYVPIPVYVATAQFELRSQ